MQEALDKSTTDALAAGDHGDPFSLLGIHGGFGEPVVIRAVLPQADSIEVIDALSSKSLAIMTRIHKDGVFEAVFQHCKEQFPYRLRACIGNKNATSWEFEDSYRFPSVLNDRDAGLFGKGEHLHTFSFMGAHPKRLDAVDGVVFTVWAPNAKRVSVVGPFNCWDGRRHVMRYHSNIGIWEIFIPGIGTEEIYKFEIKDQQNNLLPLKADPYALRNESSPSTGSIVEGLRIYDWQDGDWMAQRAKTSGRDVPISIYEVHLGSWKRVSNEKNRYLTYRELGDQLIPYVQDMGFTHIELLPIMEYPFDGSWGYQPIGLYAPTSRFGRPDDFREFIDRCHQAKIGVILDWVPGHFPSDEHGIGYFDGTHLFEHADPRQGRHMDWGTLIYNFGRQEVVNYLLSNALFWVSEFHLDALRIDAVTSMLYLDYSRKDGEWIPNKDGGRENLEAIDFLRRLNEVIYSKGEGAVTIAEESTAWPMVSYPTYLDGLGFGYKWNMGWMHDTLDFISKEPSQRHLHYNSITFGMLYAFTENFVLSLSHDEVVHGKGSILERMPGERWKKFANLRAYYSFMYTYPGKKLLFMGSEFGQEKEWSYANSLDWHSLEDSLHKGVQCLIRDLNRLYCKHAALHQKDCEQDGFQWVECHNATQLIFSYLRHGHGNHDWILVVCNFSSISHEAYRVGLPFCGIWREVLHSNASVYGGSGTHNKGKQQAEKIPWHGHGWSLALPLSPLSTMVLILD